MLYSALKADQDHEHTDYYNIIIRTLLQFKEASFGIPELPPFALLELHAEETIMKNFLQPIVPRIAIQAGHCVLVPLRPTRDSRAPDIRDYWLGVVCMPEMLPEKVAKSRPPTVFPLARPVWLIGRSVFLWIPRSNLNSLHDIQLDRYKETDLASEFATCFLLAKESNDELDYWRDTILEHKKKIEQRDITITRSSCMRHLQQSDDGVNFVNGNEKNHPDESDDSHLEDSEYEGPIRKKRRLQTAKPASGKGKDGTGSLLAPSPPPFMNGPLPTPPASLFHSSATPAASSPAGIIKPEPNDSDPPIPASDLVEIFIGPTNTKFECSRTNLAQSPILTSLITTRPSEAQQPPFIMDPSLSPILPAHFRSVLEFLNAHEYEPLLISHPTSATDGSSRLSFSLDDSRAPINHPTDLIRSAHLFNLSKQLQLPAFARLIFRKVVQGHHRYDARAFSKFALIVLEYTGLDFEIGEVGSDADAGAGAGVVVGMKGVLEEWVVKFLAENMEAFCGGSAERAVAGGYWEVLKVRGVEGRVMLRRAELGRLFPGGRIKVED